MLKTENNIRPVREKDIPEICGIYNHYILHSIITFEEVPVTAEAMHRRIEAIKKTGLPWLVYESEGQVLGYAYAAKWRTRAAYRYAAETTIYLKQGVSGKGIGTMLYSKLINRLKAQGYHVLIGGISLPNPASVALHEKLGFEKAAHFREVGFKFDRWIDVGYWEVVF